MVQADPINDAMKQALKEALTEALHEQRQLLHEDFAEVVEDFALAEAIRKGRQIERVKRDKVFDVLEDRAQKSTSFSSMTATKKYRTLGS